MLSDAGYRQVEGFGGILNPTLEDLDQAGLSVTAGHSI